MTDLEMVKSMLADTKRNYTAARALANDLMKEVLQLREQNKILLNEVDRLSEI